jgi:branched-chain amino acid transport system ATP-binding protein
MSQDPRAPLEETAAAAIRGDGIGARPLVPSAREQLMGRSQVRRDEPDAARNPGEDGPAQSWPARARTYLVDLDPRPIARRASLFPLAVLGLIGFLDAIEGGVGVLWPEMIREFHIQLATLVLINSVLIGTPVVLMGLLGGFVVDRVNRVHIYFVGKVIQGFAFMGIGVSHTTAQWAAGQGIGVTNFGGATAAFTQPARDSLLADYYPADLRGRVYGLLFFAIFGGGLVGPLVAGIAGDRFGWRLPFVILGAFGVAVAFLALLLRNPARGVQDRLALGVEGDAAQREQRPAGFLESWRAVYAVKTQRRIYYSQLCQTVGGTMFGSVLVFNLATHYHVSATTRAISISIGTVFGLLGILLSMPLIDRYIKSRPGDVMLFIGSIQVVNCFVFLGSAAVPSAVTGLGSLVLLTFLNQPVPGAQAALTSLVVPARVRGFGFKANVPFLLAGGILAYGAVLLAVSLGPQIGLLIGIPIYLAGAITTLTATSTVDSDIRAARAASVAEEEVRSARREGRETLLVCRDVDLHYGQVQILFNVDFDVERGEMVALLGTNGAGKSSLLRALTGLTQASNGAIFLNGEDITHAPPHAIAKKGVVLMSGGRGVFPGLTVEENLSAARWLVADDPEHVARQTERVLDEFFPVLRQRMGQKAGTLSGGEQQMLGLSQALIMKADLLLIDELSLGLSPGMVTQLLNVVREVNAAGTTVILVEQSVEVALSIASRAVVLEKGEVRFTGTAEELRQHPEILRALFLSSARRPGQGPSRTAKTASQSDDGRPQPVLVVNDLVVGYGGILALSGVSFRAGQGEIVGLIGPNGAGKTTLFDAITGFTEVAGGRVTFRDRDITQQSPSARARLGLVRSFQDARLFPSMTVRENLMTALEHHVKTSNPLAAAAWLPSVRRQEVSLGRRADRLIEMFNLQGYQDRFVTELSTGVHRVVDLACVMAAEPEILLLDEPSAGLSQAETEEMGPVLLRLLRETGLGLVVIEHDIKLITSISDHLVALDLGQVIAEGDPAEVIDNRAVVRSYLGAAAEATTA